MRRTRELRRFVLRLTLLLLPLLAACATPEPWHDGPAHGESAMGQSELLHRVEQWRLGLRALEKQWRSNVRRAFAQTFPHAMQRAARPMGFGVVGADGSVTPWSGDAVAPALPARVIVLVHGLDEPGDLWNVLQRELVDEGHRVLTFSYPNDQPIADSARFLGDSLRTLRSHGVREVTLICHSMGGLIARDALTHGSDYAGRARGHAALPDVPRLILVATPNRGSHLARFRGLLELREQAGLLLRGEWHPLGWIADGAGEAKVDLLPGSDYLRELNARPLPANVTVTMIVGHFLPPPPASAAAAPPALWRRVWQWSSDQLGDGVVPMASARLPGATETLHVSGHHRGILFQPRAAVGEPATVLTLVLDRVAQEHGAE